MNIGILDDHELIRIGIASALAPLPHELTISVASADQLFDALTDGKPCDLLLDQHIVLVPEKSGQRPEHYYEGNDFFLHDLITPKKETGYDPYMMTITCFGFN